MCDPNKPIRQEEGAIALLQKDVDQLQNSINHLKRSNAELKEALETDNDKEYKTAIEENIVTIARYEAKIDKLRSVIEELKHGGLVVPLEPTAMDIPDEKPGSWL